MKTFINNKKGEKERTNENYAIQAYFLRELKVSNKR